MMKWNKRWPIVGLQSRLLDAALWWRDSSGSGLQPFDDHDWLERPLIDAFSSLAGSDDFSFKLLFNLDYQRFDITQSRNLYYYFESDYDLLDEIDCAK